MRILGSKTVIFEFFLCFFDVKLEGVLRTQETRKKVPNHRVSTLVGPARRNARGAGERKRKGFRSFLGQNFRKNILGKHFEARRERRTPFCSRMQHARPRWGGGAQSAICRLSFVLASGSPQTLPNHPQNLPNLPQTLPKPAPNLPKTTPKPTRNAPKTLPKRPWNTQCVPNALQNRCFRDFFDF